MSSMPCSVPECTTSVGTHGAKGYCPKHYKRLRKNGSPTALVTTPRGSSIGYRLEAKGWDVASNGCWHYKGPRDKDGYGVIAHDRQPHRAHRVAYELTYGSIPDGLVVRHACDTPACVNPSHLNTGTHKQNTHDALVRERLANGERHGMHKLSDQEVAEIRTKYAAGGCTQYTLAADYACSQSQVSNILRGVARRMPTFTGKGG